MNDTVFNQVSLPPSPETRSPVPSYFSPVQWALYFTFIVLGLVLRWVLLDMRPYHHDESLHGMYGRYFFDFPDQNFYRYDPMLHGPMLYNTMRLIYSTFGYSDFATRTPVAIFGSLFLFLPFVFRRYFSWNGTVLAITAFIALSPTLVYWSRFLREDYWVLLGMLSVLYGATLAPDRWRSTFVLLGISLNWCTKANLFVHAAIIIGYLVFEYVFRIVLLLFRDSEWREKPRPEVFWIGVAVSIGVACVLGLATREIFDAPRSIFLGVATAFFGLGIFASTCSSLFPEEIFNLRRFLEVIGGTVVLAALTAVLCYLIFPTPQPADPQLRWLAAGITVLGIGILGALGAASRQDYLLSRAARSVSRYPIETILGFAIAFAIYAWFYTAGFRYGEGLSRGFYAGIEYWTHQHSINRIDGPFSFHVYHLSWYESAFILAFLLHAGLFYWKAPLGIQIGATLSVLLQVVARIVFRTFSIQFDAPETKPFFKGILQIGDGIDFHVEMLLLTHALLVTITYVLRGDRRLSFFSYFFAATFFTYCYLGEKVPWLSTYILVSGILFLPLFFENHFRNNPFNFREVPLRNVFVTVGMVSILLGLFFVLEAKGPGWNWQSAWRPVIAENSGFLAVGAVLVGLSFLDLGRPTFGTINIATATLLIVSVYNFRATIQTNFRFGGEASEYISQVHTTYDMQEVALRIRQDILGERLGFRPKVLVTGEGTWPLTWYFRDLSEYRFSATDSEKKDFMFIIQDIKDSAPEGYIPEGYSFRKVNLRGWWVPDLGQISFKKFLNYAVNHTPWNSTGYSTVSLLTAKDPARFR